MPYYKKTFHVPTVILSDSSGVLGKILIGETESVKRFYYFIKINKKTS